MEPNWQLARKQDALIKRARIIQQIRAFFVAQNFIEVETPHRLPANAPELYIDAIAAEDWFLQTSPELCMKRLLAAGYDNIFQLCRCWRAGERSNRHLPEYTMLEWYRRDRDYHDLMTDCENLINALCPICPNATLNYQGHPISLQSPWLRLSVAEAFDRYASTSLETALANDEFDTAIALQIEPQLPVNQPVFLIDYPIQHASLARRKTSNPAFAERFELYIGGMELANGFSELTDAQEQRQRFSSEEAIRRDRGKTPYPTAEAFLRELALLDSAAGIALGIDRLIMLLCDLQRIDDCVAFPPEIL